MILRLFSVMSKLGPYFLHFVLHGASYMTPICVNLLLGFYFNEWKVGRLTQYIANGLDVGILLMCAT